MASTRPWVAQRAFGGLAGPHVKGSGVVLMHRNEIPKGGTLEEAPQSGLEVPTGSEDHPEGMRALSNISFGMNGRSPVGC